MFTHEESSTLLDSTMDVLESDLGSLTPESGTSVIDQWLAQLNKAENTKDITSTLEQIKVQAETNPANTGELAKLLDTLATQTVEFSTMMGPEGDIATRLEALSAALRSIAGQLGNQ